MIVGYLKIAVVRTTDTLWYEVPFLYHRWLTNFLQKFLLDYFVVALFLRYLFERLFFSCSVLNWNKPMVTLEDVYRTSAISHHVVYMCAYVELISLMLMMVWEKSDGSIYSWRREKSWEERWSCWSGGVEHTPWLPFLFAENDASISLGYG